MAIAAVADSDARWYKRYILWRYVAQYDSSHPTNIQTKRATPKQVGIEPGTSLTCQMVSRLGSLQYARLDCANSTERFSPLPRIGPGRLRSKCQGVGTQLNISGCKKRRRLW